MFMTAEKHSKRLSVMRCVHNSYGWSGSHCSAKTGNIYENNM